MKGVDFTKRLNSLVEKYNDRSDNAVFAQEVLDEVAKQMAELLKEVNKEKKSFKDLGITYEEKAFYDILKEIAHKFGFEYPEDKLLTLAAAVKKMVDDKSKYTDWANRSDIKAELQMDLILILAEHGYPPVPQDEVFKEIFEQAENFKKYDQEDDIKEDAPIKFYKLENVEDDRDVRNLIFNRLHMDVSISDGELQREVIELYGERYPNMLLNDWRHIIEAYTPMVREAVLSKAKEVSIQTEQLSMAAESLEEANKDE
jgi:type I restriction enzyme R subunit